MPDYIEDFERIKAKCEEKHSLYFILAKYGALPGRVSDIDCGNASALAWAVHLARWNATDPSCPCPYCRACGSKR